MKIMNEPMKITRFSEMTQEEKEKENRKIKFRIRNVPIKFRSKYNYPKNDCDCWEWNAYKNSDGYGCFKNKKRAIHAHRYSYEFYRGIIPYQNEYGIRIYVLHTCNNPGCINPFHLYLGTQQDNMNDMVKSGNANGAINPYRGGANNPHRGGPTNPAKGEAHGNAKLTEKNILEIRALYMAGDWTHQKLGDLYGVGRKQISRIIHYKRWKHVV